MKCEVCHKEKAVLWFGLLSVCQDCFNDLVKRKQQVQKEKQNEG